MKPNELLTTADGVTDTLFIMSQPPVIKTELSPDAGAGSSNNTTSEFSGMDPSISGNMLLVSKTSPAADVLDFITEDSMTTADVGDPSSLIIDLNDLLKRDPTLSSLTEDSLSVDIAGSTVGSGSNSAAALSGSMSSNMDIPSRRGTTTILGNSTSGNMVRSSSSQGALVVPNNSPATWTDGRLETKGGGPPPNATIKMDTELLYSPGSGYGQGIQPTLAELNSPPNHQHSGIKMETNDLDLDDLESMFLTISSPNVSFGVAPSKPMMQNRPPGSSGGVRVGGGKPTSFNTNFWQIDEPPFSVSANPWASASNPASSTVNASALSSSVPATLFSNISPLSDILTDLSSSSVSTAGGSAGTPPTAVSPNLPSNSPSQAGPTRHSTLHKLLMRKDPVMSRPPPVRSPEGTRPTKTLGRMRSSLSASNPLLSQQLSSSAPTQTLVEGQRIWARREPRPHISSVCSVGEASSIADDVNEVLSRLSPNDLQDIASDDEDEDNDNNMNDKDSSDDDSDLEGTSPSTSGKHQGSKKERHFWQYNVQAKGPKGQKINFETKIEDPHVLNDIVDPVFSGDVQLQGIKHSGKARRGDGNDLTANPKKLAAIGKELDQLSKIINDLTPVSEMPFGARCKSRKEKNKLASRACRLKKKAQHEANKLKCDGLKSEHNELIYSIAQARKLLVAKVDRNCTRSQQEMSAEMDRIVYKATKTKVAGQTTTFVNTMIEQHLPFL